MISRSVKEAIGLEHSIPKNLERVKKREGG